MTREEREREETVAGTGTGVGVNLAKAVIKLISLLEDARIPPERDSTETETERTRFFLLKTVLIIREFSPPSLVRSLSPASPRRLAPPRSAAVPFFLSRRPLRASRLGLPSGYLLSFYS